jgi:hypothetical protein
MPELASKSESGRFPTKLPVTSNSRKKVEMGRMLQSALREKLNVKGLSKFTTRKGMAVNELPLTSKFSTTGRGENA